MGGTEKVILALGGNVGNVKDTFEKTLRMMAKDGKIAINKCSDLYRSLSLLKDDQPDYYNMVLSGKTKLSPHELLDYIKKLETKLGRVVTSRWHERNIDIDIIDYGNMMVLSDVLTLPHSEMKNRSFVLEPMRQIEPDYTDPETKQSIDMLCNRLQDKLGIKKEGSIK